MSAMAVGRRVAGRVLAGAATSVSCRSGCAGAGRSGGEAWAVGVGGGRGWFFSSPRGFASKKDYPEHTLIEMPAMSPTMEKGTIATWHLGVGDEIAPGTLMLAVETDKATLDVEGTEEGFLAKILVEAGARDVPVGAPIAVVATNQADVTKFKGFKADGKPPSGGKPAGGKPAAEPAPAPPAPVAKQAKLYPNHEVLKMPSLSPTMDSGTLAKWLMDKGAELTPGTVVAEIETDKATLEMEVQEEGFLARILVPAGTKDVAVGTAIAVLAEHKADIDAFEDFEADPPRGGTPKAVPPPVTPAAAPRTSAPAAAASPAAPAAAASPPIKRDPGARIVASPLAKVLASERGIDLAAVQGTGPGGRITREDVESFKGGSGGASSSAYTAPVSYAAGTAGGGHRDVPHTQIRRIVAERLQQSKATVPHYYLSADCRVDALMKARESLNGAKAPDAPKVSVNDLVVKAAALALRQVPDCNASWYDDFMRVYDNIDICVAVQTEAGLMVPVVRDADRKGLGQIASEVKSLAARARDGKLTPEEMTGGTFTISNLGMFGVKSFSAIINTPQACILAVGAAEKRVVAAPDGMFDEAQFMTVTLSCDHRVIDGAMGATWLQAFKRYIEDPMTMML